MRDDVVLIDPWWDLRNPGEPEQQQLQAIRSELLREAPAGHPLYGMAFTVIGQSQARDDVLLRVHDRWALIHLTWSGKPEVSRVEIVWFARQNRLPMTLQR